MRVPRQPAYYRLTEPADEPENPWDRPKGRKGWPRWVALLVAAAVLVTAALGWSTRRSAPPAPPPAPAGEAEAPDRGASPTEGQPSVRPSAE